MARTIEEILEEMSVKAAEHEQLTDLEANTSTVSVWHYAKRLFALCVMQLEVSMETFKEEINSLLVISEIGGLNWYRSKCLDYQHGDVLSVSNNQAVYAQDDDEKKIIKHVSVSESDDAQVLVKVVKEGFEPLTSDELAGFITYINKIKIMGTLISVSSQAANEVAYELVVEVDKAKINDEGGFVDGSKTTPIYDALDVFHQNIDFNNTLYLSKAVDALQQIEGVIDVQLKVAKHYDGTDWQVIDRKYDSEAGFVTLNREVSNITIV